MTTETAAQNVEAVRRSMDTMESGDRDRLRRLVDETVHPDCEWTPLIAVGVEASYRGRDGIASFFEDFRGSFEVHYAEPQLRALGDTGVLLLCRLKLKGRESGLEIDQEMGSVFEFEDAMLRRGHAYPTHAEAIAAGKELAA